MAEQNPIQRALDQLSDVLQNAEDVSKKPLKGNVPPDWQARLNALGQMVAQFQAINEKILQDAGLSSAGASEKSMQLNEKDRLILERANTLVRNARKGYQNISFSINEVQKLKKAPAARKKKFDRLGGRKKWKPM